jgi:hypothetical protein
MSIEKPCSEAKPHLISPKDMPLGFHMVGWKFKLHLDLPLQSGEP